MIENNIETLYDHYKDTFSKIKECEKQRNRLFFIVIGFLGLLVLQLMYSIALSEVVKQINILGCSLNLKEIPISVLVSLTWTFFSMILLRYYQIIVQVDKQYSYLHDLEENLSNSLGESKIISRESSGYLTDKYSWFRHWIWIFYTAIYPVIIIVSISLSFKLEWSAQNIPMYHKIYDTVLGILAIISMILYLLGNWFEK